MTRVTARASIANMGPGVSSLRGRELRLAYQLEPFSSSRSA